MNYRKERIDRLLQELRYEVERGVMEREIEETITFQFVVPMSSSIPDGMVHCRFATRPITKYEMFGEIPERLRVVK